MGDPRHLHSAVREREWTERPHTLRVPFVGRRLVVFVEQLAECREGLFAVTEPVIRWRGRNGIAIGELSRQSDQRELVGDGMFVESMFHTCEADPPSESSRSW